MNKMLLAVGVFAVISCNTPKEKQNPVSELKQVSLNSSRFIESIYCEFEDSKGREWESNFKLPEKITAAIARTRVPSYLQICEDMRIKDSAQKKLDADISEVSIWGVRPNATNHALLFEQLMNKPQRIDKHVEKATDAIKEERGMAEIHAIWCETEDKGNHEWEYKIPLEVYASVEGAKADSAKYLAMCLDQFASREKKSYFKDGLIYEMAVYGLSDRLKGVTTLYKASWEKGRKPTDF